MAFHRWQSQVRKNLVCLFPLLLLGACAEQQTPFKASDMPRFDAEELAVGRSVWMGTCRNCHLLGVAGAPAVTDYQAWSPRIAKGQQLLYASALDGIREGEGEIRMPPRGGNPRLSEDQVKRHLFWGDYWILDLGEEYEYAVIGMPSRKHAWILSRIVQLSPEVRSHIRQVLIRAGYDPKKLEETQHKKPLKTE